MVFVVAEIVVKRPEIGSRVHDLGLVVGRNDEFRNSPQNREDVSLRKSALGVEGEPDQRVGACQVFHVQTRNG